MGKPFKEELNLIHDTIKWTKSLDLKPLKGFLDKLQPPIYVVGSGGSLSACHFLVSLLSDKGKFAKATTPLELFYLNATISRSSIVFITASGRNYDIKFAFRKTVELEPKAIGVITTRAENPIAQLCKKYGIPKSFDFDIPTGKDGFLATNSLAAFYSILIRVFHETSPKIIRPYKEALQEIKAFVQTIGIDCTITVLYGGWGKSIALDIESKCSEAGLTPTLISDYRNFGHGRHNWFSKRPNSAILAISDPTNHELCQKTLKALPSEIPKLVLHAGHHVASGSLEHLIKSFYFIQFLGEKNKIDPGRPGVPAYGRKLYHLPYSNLLASPNPFKLSKRAKVAIKRKLMVDDLSLVKEDELKVWKKSYNRFMTNLNKARFGMLLMDYDGTICDAERRYDGPNYSMQEGLLTILRKGFLLGIITGRGKSVRLDLQKVLPEEFWERVIVGYYNGSDYGILSDNTLPNKTLDTHDDLKPVLMKIEDISELYGIKLSHRPNQLTIEIDNKKRWGFIKNLIIQTIKTSCLENIQILESSHSMDLIPISVSKTNIIPYAKEILSKYNLPSDILSIGDKGQWSGNDFMLLDNEFGLSVDEVSSKLNTCWNVASVGNRNSKATLEYLDCLVFGDSGIHFKMNK